MVLISKCNREANEVADVLAKEALTRPFGFECFSVLFDFLSVVLCKDVDGVQQPSVGACSNV